MKTSLSFLFAGTFVLAVLVGNSRADTLEIDSFETQPFQWQAAMDQPDRAPFTKEASAQKIKEGSASARWSVSQRPWAIMKHAPEDWSSYQALSLWIYADKANGQVLNFWVYSGEGGQNYYFHKLVVDWTGWKQIVLPLSEFHAVRDPAGWNKVTGFMISGKGGEAAPLADSVLWLDDIKLESL
ncbi:carbohydrate binding domain-containing protein [Terrimicrobium sacchariphilum]|uniref:Carbohydrate binding domain-containing protein n=1 Tax=Terrimicrobium sacchariphilum TaxID=690879 RepID=A0A146G1Y9_TERSA|nr:carbohydrate binding domain-containing protein [Terrimicrobium sacchariphilum]GAT31845.1 carbohydrate binding domain-containing protein [Terrimicrobium sacchariphilum]